MAELGARRATRKVAQNTDRPRTKRGQREATHEKLLNAARSLFIAVGYRSTTLESISSKVGLTKGAVYFHFRSKEKLLLALLDRANAAVIVPSVEPLTSLHGTAGDKLVNFAHTPAELGLSRRDDIMLLISMSLEFAQRRGPVNDRIKQIYQIIYDRLEAVIEEGQQKGELRRNAPVREMAAVLVANHDGAFLEWYRRGRRLDGDHLVRALRVLLLEGYVVASPEQ